MSKLFPGSINFPSTMKPTGAQPLDDRAVVDAFSALTDNSTFGGAKYDGMIVAVVEDQKAYMLVDSDNSTLPESWVCLGANADVNVDDEHINQLINDILANKEYITESDINVKDVQNNGTTLVNNGVVDLSKTLSDYYNKTEIDDKFKTIDLFSIVEVLPEGDEINPNKIYLINNNGEEGNTFTEYIYTNGKWETIGNLSVDTDFTNYYTKEEVDGMLNTKTITLSEDIKDDENSETITYYSGKTVQEILKDLSLRIKNINAGGSGNLVSIESGEGINITEEESGSKKISVAISNAEGNAISATTDGSLYVKNLEDRLALLESLLSAFTENGAEFITTENIGKHAITSISYGNDTNDIIVLKDGTTGAVTLELDSITNIAYGDAEIIPEN